MSLQLIHQYYKQSDSLKRVGVSNEMAIKQPFDALLLNFASQKNNVYVTEVTIKNEKDKNIRPDGILMNELRIHKGYVESKDGNDSLDFEINKKLYKDLYPKFNIIFQDSIEAVLIQNGTEVLRIKMNEAEDLETIIQKFINYKPEYIAKFEEALQKFKEDIPTIVETLRTTINEQYQKNKFFQTASEDFFEMCQKEINPQISKEDIREMIIQHILTEDLFKSVFDESDFHHENNIASQLENLVNSFMTRTIRQNQLNELGHYYKTLNAQASKVSDHHEKQKFLKVVYENFYKVYNPKGADKLGVVYTPNEIVRFMVRSTDFLLQKHFNRNLADKNVNIMDPATGTGTFITDIIDFIPQQYLEHKYKHEIFANEVAILPYYVANLNIEYTYKQKMGNYVEFPNSCFVDTLENVQGFEVSMGKKLENYKIPGNLFGFSTENSIRIERQNAQKISIIIGNPPYNANQQNFNDFNKNRTYRLVDKRIKDTYVKFSKAQKTKVYDPFARFYRWASDRIDENGIVAFITNRAFIDTKTYDGFRKSIEKDFEFIYIIDLKGDIRGKNKAKAAKGNVFGIQTGVAIMFLIKNKTKSNEKAIIEYLEISDDLDKFKKLELLNNNRIEDLKFDKIVADKNYNWLDLSEDNDWESFLPLIDKEVKAGKHQNALFKNYSFGTSTNRDEWVYDKSQKNLLEKAQFLSEEYNQSIKNKKLSNKIKWSDSLNGKFNTHKLSKFDKKNITKTLYRPFIKEFYYTEKIFSDRLTQNHFDFFGKKLDKENKIVALINHSQLTDFDVFSSDVFIDAGFSGRATPFIPLYFYENTGIKRDNITDWGQKQFQDFYQEEISKEDIFNYCYAILHHKQYRKKYELNLKRDFPRIPFYEDFVKWSSFGEELMALHLDYETAIPFDLKVVEKGNPYPKEYKLKIKLKADKDAGIIYLDEVTSLENIPKSAWEYKLGNRSALEWILDQYKEKKPRDQTIAEKFNTYLFSDYKKEVIDLLKKITTVSVRTVEIVNLLSEEK